MDTHLCPWEPWLNHSLSLMCGNTVVLLLLAHLYLAHGSSTVARQELSPSCSNTVRLVTPSCKYPVFLTRFKRWPNPTSYAFKTYLSVQCILYIMGYFLEVSFQKMAFLSPILGLWRNLQQFSVYWQSFIHSFNTSWVSI